MPIDRSTDTYHHPPRDPPPRRPPSLPFTYHHPPPPPPHQKIHPHPSIRCSNAHYQSKIAVRRGGPQFLAALGFVEEVQGGLGHEIARDPEAFKVRWCLGGGRGGWVL